MSVKAMSAVWERSKAKGSNLLVLLAIADWAKDDGRDAWPSLGALAAKSRLTTKAVKYILAKLQKDGELVVEVNHLDRAVTETYTPELFMHVLCVSEKFSDTKPAKISDRSAQFSDTSENDGTAYKEEPSSDPSSEPLGRTRTFGDQRKKRSHRRHAYCGERFCVPDFLHDQFIQGLGSEANDVDWFALYSEWDTEAGDEVIPEQLSWLKNKFKERTSETEGSRR